jgi:hypothetical protein
MMKSMSTGARFGWGALIPLAFALGGAGCSDSDSPAGQDASTADAAAADVASADTTTGPDLAADLAPDGPPAAVAAFVGEWLVTSGSAQASMCEGIGDLPAQSLDGSMVNVKVGTDAALELTLSGCTFKFDVNGSVATARPGQSCMTVISVAGVMFMVTLSFDTSTFTVAADGGMLVQTGHAMATMPVPVTCTYKLMATGVKVMGNRDGGADGALPDAGASNDAGAAGDAGPAADAPAADAPAADGP